MTATLIQLNDTPPESMKAQVLQMVVDYLSDISPISLTASNPLYQLYQYVIGFEVHLHLEAMTGTADSPSQLILALDAQDPARVLGFALYLTSPEEPELCNVAYLAVQAEQRQNGIARAMLQKIRQQHPRIELACMAKQAPFFETLGFQALAALGPQVLMSTADERSSSLLPAQDLTPIFQSLEVKQIHAYLLKQNGKAAMQAAELDRDELLDELAEQAQQLLKSRRH